MIFSKVIDIQNFLNLVIKHYPNYMRITDELQLVVNSIDNEVSKRSYHGNKIQNTEPSLNFWILFPGLDNGDEIWHMSDNFINSDSNIDRGSKLLPVEEVLSAD